MSGFRRNKYQTIDKKPTNNQQANLAQSSLLSLGAQLVLWQAGKTMSRIVAVICMLLVTPASALAIECQTNMQSGNEHWTWRLIDGRQCWYKGASGTDKSLLHWSAGKGGLDKPGETPDKPKIDKTQAMLEPQRSPAEILEMLPIMPPQPTFEDRWRLR
jgi:hypothetical protein